MSGNPAGLPDVDVSLVRDIAEGASSGALFFFLCRGGVLRGCDSMSEGEKLVLQGYGGMSEGKKLVLRGCDSMSEGKKLVLQGYGGMSEGEK